jgi:dimethylhistidine N-methyltransferase
MKTAGHAHALAPRSPRLTFRQDVMAGLSKKKKSIPAKYFYDARGSRLYDEICGLDEYYPTKTELGILRSRALEIGAMVGAQARIVELGSGSSNKTHALLGGLVHPAQYVLVDISKEPLEASAARLRADRAGLDVRTICADYTQSFTLPPCAAATRTVAYFPGSTIGNFTPEEARDFLSRVRRMVGATGALVLGVDTPKDPAVLHAAYNDAKGVTAEFNKNLLHRMNHELFARFDVDAFWHHAFYDPKEGRIEMHLVSSARQIVQIAGRAFVFDEGESITTEYSYKYAPDRIARLAQSAGFNVERSWTDARRYFSVQFLSAASRR